MYRTEQNNVPMQGKRVKEKGDEEGGHGETKDLSSWLSSVACALI